MYLCKASLNFNKFSTGVAHASRIIRDKNSTNEEIDKLGDTGSKKSNSGGFDDDINLDEVRAN